MAGLRDLGSSIMEGIAAIRQAEQSGIAPEALGEVQSSVVELVGRISSISHKVSEAVSAMERSTRVSALVSRPVSRQILTHCMFFW